MVFNKDGEEPKRFYRGRLLRLPKDIHGGSFWLIDFHERVMRDNHEVAIYRRYIRENPEKLERWEF